jgi:hypothetical protein
MYEMKNCMKLKRKPSYTKKTKEKHSQTQKRCEFFIMIPEDERKRSQTQKRWEFYHAPEDEKKNVHKHRKM